jgi:glycosyltransferase involved in cell wall biosynthesis
MRVGARSSLRLVGTGPLEASLRARTAKATRTRGFLGYRDDMPDVLAAADIDVLTSFKEGCARRVLEAMAMGLPVVGTRVSGTKEAIRDGEKRILVGSATPTRFANALETLIDDPVLRSTMGRERTKGRAHRVRRKPPSPRRSRSCIAIASIRSRSQTLENPVATVHGVPRSGR